MLAEAAQADAAEDARYGSEQTGQELPAELQRRQTRLEKIRQAQKALKQRARDKAAAQDQSPEEVRKAKPRDKDQYNFSDPESRIMKGGDGFLQAYNAQAAVEGVCQLIVGQRVTQAANDKEQLQPLLQAVEQQARSRTAPDWIRESVSTAFDEFEPEKHSVFLAAVAGACRSDSRSTRMARR